MNFLMNLVSPPTPPPTPPPKKKCKTYKTEHQIAEEERESAEYARQKAADVEKKHEKDLKDRWAQVDALSNKMKVIHATEDDNERGVEHGIPMNLWQWATVQYQDKGPNRHVTTDNLFKESFEYPLSSFTNCKIKKPYCDIDQYCNFAHGKCLPNSHEQNNDNSGKKRKAAVISLEGGVFKRINTGKRNKRKTNKRKTNNMKY